MCAPCFGHNEVVLYTSVQLFVVSLQSNIIQDSLIATPLPLRMQKGTGMHRMSGQSTTRGLATDLKTLRDDLQKASEVVARLYEGLEETRITPAKTRMEIASLFDDPLPEDPQPTASILSEVEHKIFANSTLYLSPRFFGYINSGGNYAAVLGDLLASAVNQICALWHFSPAASEVEWRVVRWIAEFIGYPSEAGGCLLSGGVTSWDWPSPADRKPRWIQHLPGCTGLLR